MEIKKSEILKIIEIAEKDFGDSFDLQDYEELEHLFHFIVSNLEDDMGIEVFLRDASRDSYLELTFFSNKIKKTIFLEEVPEIESYEHLAKYLLEKILEIEDFEKRVRLEK